jgi:hypothetical protein
MTRLELMSAASSPNDRSVSLRRFFLLKLAMSGVA